MGKIKKIKEDRKRQEVERQMEKIKNRRLYFKLFILLLFIFVLTGAGSYGYKYADSKWSVGGKISNIVSKVKIGKGKEEKKEEKVDVSSTDSTNITRKYSNAPEMQIEVNKKYVAKFETTKGNFEVELYPQKAPKTVNNFVFLAKNRFYDGLIFHRVIKDFMIQGGDPNGNGTGDPGYKFEDEINDVKLVRGVLAMANSGEDTNGSQFFVVTAESTPWLDGKHTAFGKIISGLDIVMAIQEVETGENDKPKIDVKINKISITES